MLTRAPFAWVQVTTRQPLRLWCWQRRSSTRSRSWRAATPANEIHVVQLGRHYEAFLPRLPLVEEVAVPTECYICYEPAHSKMGIMLPCHMRHWICVKCFGQQINVAITREGPPAAYDGEHEYHGHQRFHCSVCKVDFEGHLPALREVFQPELSKQVNLND
eukprot:COSAG06_NODE_24599_length_657_cov_14.311828_1_plen_161_part_00